MSLGPQDTMAHLNHVHIWLSFLHDRVKEDAFRKGDKLLCKQAKYTLEKEIRVVKRNHQLHERQAAGSKAGKIFIQYPYI